MAEPTAADLRKMGLKVIASENKSTVTPGTAINPTSNTNAVFVRVINNNLTALVAVGMQDAEVDASVSPLLGFVLGAYASRTFAVNDDASEVFIDADTAGTQVSIEIFGR